MHVRVRNLDQSIVDRIAGALRVRPATARCLVARGVVEPRDAQGFIDPRLAALRPPSGLAGLSVAVERIANAVERGEPIGVFGDYDVDGITTAALLTSFLRTAGARVHAAVARREAGYGFTPEPRRILRCGGLRMTPVTVERRLTISARSSGAEVP